MLKAARQASKIADIRDCSKGACRTINLPGPLKMHRGGELPEVHITYECWGELSAEKDNAVLVFTGLSPTAHAASSPRDTTPGWWEYMIGPGKPLDTNHYHVICVNSLGSCFGSSGPSSVDPRTGKQYRLSFPDLSIEDIAAAGHAVIQALNIPCVRAVVGCSLGGMTALSYAVHYPEETHNVVVVSGAAKATPHAIGIRSLQREIIRNDPDWMGGNYPADKEPVEGMRLARKLGLISYRSADEWDERFGRDMINAQERKPFGAQFQIESYLEANAQKFVGSFDANSYLYLSRAMDWFDLGDHQERLIALCQFSAGKKALVIGVETDTLFPIHQQQSVAAMLTESGLDVSYHALPSLQGHDAFLVDKECFAPLIEEFFNKL
ncbi:MAG: homoserine O-acetyltransferase [Pseudomonadota bacterium]